MCVRLIQRWCLIDIVYCIVLIESLQTMVLRSIVLRSIVLRSIVLKSMILKSILYIYTDSHNSNIGAPS